MGRWLTDLADVCRATGFGVIELDGWQEASRGGAGGAQTDGYQSGHPNHVIVHHTASGPHMDGYPDANYCTYSHQDSPICNLYLSRVPEIYVCAAGATNTNGPGVDYCGIVADDSMNAAAIGIEAGNDGIGEPWPEVMLDAYVRLCAELCAAYGIGVDQVHSHLEWAGPARKIDPAGPHRYASGSASWTMDAFRADVARGGPPTPLPPEDDLTPEQAQQLAEIHANHVRPLPGNLDPNGAEMNSAWTAFYALQVAQDLQRRMWAVEDALHIPH